MEAGDLGRVGRALQTASICHSLVSLRPTVHLPPGSEGGVGCALMVLTPAASGIQGSRLAKGGCLSCQKQRRENTTKLSWLQKKTAGKMQQKKLFQENK